MIARAGSRLATSLEAVGGSTPGDRAPCFGPVPDAAMRYTPLRTRKEQWPWHA
jgi:hypothetical protein